MRKAERKYWLNMQTCRMAFLIFSLLLSPFSFLVSQAFGGYLVDFKTSAKNFSDTIAIEWTGHQVYVPVVINGQHMRFLLDTGAGQSVVYEGTELANGPSAGSIVSHDATGGSSTVNMVMLPPITLGNTTLTGCRATVQPGPAPRGVDGLLGFDLVNGGLSLTIDVPRQLLIITDRFLPSPPRGGSIRYRLNYHVPYIDIYPFGRQRERVLIDTGSPRFFAMNKQHFDDALLDMLPRHADPATVSRWGDLTIEGRAIGRHAIGHYGVEPLGEVAFLCLNHLQIGSSVFSDLHCITTQGGSHLGAALLQHAVVTFDAKRKRVTITPCTDGEGDASVGIPVGNRQLEMAFVANNDGLPQVGLVLPQSDPYRQGFRQGDVIEQIDGRPVLSLAQFMRWGFEVGRTYTFTLRATDGQQHTANWVRIAK